MGIRQQIIFPKLNFAQFVNQNVKILVRKLYSPSLKAVAWLGDAQLTFLIFHIFVYKWGWLDGRLEAVRGEKTQTYVWNIRKNQLSLF